MSEELAQWKYKKRKVEEELEVKQKSYKEAVKQFKEKDRRYIQETQTGEVRF